MSKNSQAFLYFLIAMSIFSFLCINFEYFIFKNMEINSDVITIYRVGFMILFFHSSLMILSHDYLKKEYSNLLYLISMLLASFFIAFLVSLFIEFNSYEDNTYIIYLSVFNFYTLCSFIMMPYRMKDAVENNKKVENEILKIQDKFLNSDVLVIDNNMENLFALEKEKLYEK